MTPTPNDSLSIVLMDGECVANSSHPWQWLMVIGWQCQVAMWPTPSCVRTSYTCCVFRDTDTLAHPCRCVTQTGTCIVCLYWHCMLVSFDCFDCPLSVVLDDLCVGGCALKNGKCSLHKQCCMSATFHGCNSSLVCSLACCIGDV